MQHSMVQPAILAHGDSLSNIIESLPYSAHLRDAKTGRFLMANQYQAINNNLKTIDEVLMATPDDLHHRHSNLLANLGAASTPYSDYLSLFQKAFYRAKNLQLSTSFKEETILLKSGFVYVGINSKVPILGRNQDTCAVFTHTKDITAQIELFYLYQLYKRIYCSEQLAIRYFLGYLTIDDYFVEMPTNTEILILLALQQAPTYKLASQFLKNKNGIFIKSGTISTHLQNLRRKFKVGTHLDQLLIKLREKPEPQVII